MRTRYLSHTRYLLHIDLSRKHDTGGVLHKMRSILSLLERQLACLHVYISLPTMPCWD